MAILTFDIDAEIDKVWHFDIGIVDYLIRGGLYAKHILESYAIDSAVYELVPDTAGRSVLIASRGTGEVGISFLVRKIGTQISASMTQSVPVGGPGNPSTVDFLNAFGLLRDPDYLYKGVTVTLRTLAIDTTGTVWRHTGHYSAAKEPYFRSSQSVSDAGLTLTDLDAQHGPITPYKP